MNVSTTSSIRSFIHLQDTNKKKNVHTTMMVIVVISVGSSRASSQQIKIEGVIVSLVR